MLSSFRKRFGIPGVLAVVALVFAMVGGAWASGVFTKKQEKKITEIAKKYAGKDGAPGAPGLQGPAGKDGANGSDGANGAKGATGAAGVTGATGVAGNKGATGVTGVTGVTGATGATGPFGPSLEPGHTEKGTWSFTASKTDGEIVGVLANIGFPIPLAASLDASHVHMINPASGKEVIYNGVTETDEEVTQTTCTGTAQNPTAPNGHLCVYQLNITGAVFNSILDASELSPGAAKVGALIGFNKPTLDGAFGVGTWAVTAP